MIVKNTMKIRRPQYLTVTLDKLLSAKNIPSMHRFVMYDDYKSSASGTVYKLSKKIFKLKHLSNIFFRPKEYFRYETVDFVPRKTFYRVQRAESALTNFRIPSISYGKQYETRDF